MLFTKVVGILKVLFGWVGRDWNGFYRVLQIFEIGFQEKIVCKHFRAQNKFFKFWGRSSKVGIFVEIAVYFGGAHRGGIMVPASLNRSGWCLFTKELDSFLSGSNFVWVEGKTVDVAVGGGQDGKKSLNIGNQRKLRNLKFLE